MKLKSSERSTGMGATHYAAVSVDGAWVRVSRLPDALYIGRDHGWEEYEVEIVDDALHAQFDRSNSGKEEVTVSRGDAVVAKLRSFDHARRWLEAH